jgi:hypothetical protein
MVRELSEDGAHREILWPEAAPRLVTFEVRRIWAFEKTVCLVIYDFWLKAFPKERTFHHFLPLGIVTAL